MALIQTTHGAHGTVSTSTVVTYSSTPTTGNFLVVGLWLGTTTVTSMTPPSGWSLATSKVSNDGTIYIYYKENCGTTTSFTWTYGSVTSMMVAAEYSNVLTSSSLDTVASSSGTTDPTVSGTTATTASANELWIAVLENNSASAFTTITNGFTKEVSDLSYGTIGLFDKTVSTTGTASTSVSGAGNGWYYAGAIATFATTTTTVTSWNLTDTALTTSDSATYQESVTSTDSATQSLYLLISDASSTLSTASQLTTSGNGTAANTSVTSLVASGTLAGEICALGNGSGWPYYGSLPAPTGKGWLLDNASYEGRSIQAGTWYLNARVGCSTGNAVGTLTMRVYRRNKDGSYNNFGSSALAVTVNTTSSVFTFPVFTTSITRSFYAGDQLYVDLWFNISANNMGNINATVRIASMSAAPGTVNSSLVFPPLTNLESVTFASTVTSTDSLTVSETCTISSAVAYVDSQTVSESATYAAPMTALDMLTFSDMLVWLSSATLFLTGVDSLTCSDAMTMMSTSSYTDTLSVSETCSALGSVAYSDSLIVTESVIYTTVLLLVDVALLPTDSGVIVTNVVVLVAVAVTVSCRDGIVSTRIRDGTAPATVR